MPCRGVWLYALSFVLLLVSLSAAALTAPQLPPRISSRNGPNSSPRRSKKARCLIASGGAPSRQYRPVVDAFSKKFGVKVEVSTGNATDTVNRVLAERKAGRYTMDVALISSRENQQRSCRRNRWCRSPPCSFHPEVVDTVELVPRQAIWYADKASASTRLSTTPA